MKEKHKTNIVYRFFTSLNITIEREDSPKLSGEGKGSETTTLEVSSETLTALAVKLTGRIARNNANEIEIVFKRTVLNFNGTIRNFEFIID